MCSGTHIVLEAAAACGVESFVNISTDKAADPVSVLGYSKRIGERLTAHMASQSDGTYLSVRFGNVLGSRGSVLTALLAQVDNGGPVTVTHPDATRYFMTVDEAVQLVLQAAVIGSEVARCWCSTWVSPYGLPTSPADWLLGHRGR